MARTRWSKSESGNIWLPAPSRRTLITGASAGAAALLLGCGDESKPPGAAPSRPGTGGAPTGTGGAPTGTGGAPTGTGGTPAGTGGAPAGTGGAPTGTGGTPAGTGGNPGTPDAGGPTPGPADMGTTPTDMGGGIADPNEVPSPPAQAPACTRRDPQTAGPYPLSRAQLNRADIRSDPTNGEIMPGVPLRVVLRVGRGMGGCQPMPGAVVNLWQCDARGNYSGYGSAQGRQFLRGFQVADNSGVVEFMTIYPGPYSGRSIHIHFSVRMNTMVSFPGGFVSQIYFPEEVNDEATAMAPYSRTRVRNSQDGIFDPANVAKMSKAGKGWVAEFDVGV